MSEPLTLVVDVGCPPERAFELWTARTGTWWPASHTVTARRDLEVIIEPEVGGRIFERTPEGEEHDWGRVTVWEPPRRLGYTWHLRQDAGDATQVDITFGSDGEAGTRLSIVHRGWEMLGGRGDAAREANERGWSGLLPRFRAAAG